MDTKKGMTEASMRKLQRRKFYALKAIVTALFVASLVANVKIDAFAACKKETARVSIVHPDIFKYLYFRKEVPPTEEKSWEDRKTAYDYSDDELLAMYQVVQAEAGAESMRGKTAVAAVILNRFFGDNAFTPGEKITSLIVPGQFARSNYSLEWFKANNPSVIKAVEYACQGYDPTAECYPEEGALYYYAEWNIGEFGETTIINKGTKYESIVIDRQCYHQ